MPLPHARPPLLRQRRSGAGFTLLEACLAFGALSLGVLALGHLQAALQTSIEFARERSQAVRVAQAALERQRHLAAPEPHGAAAARAPAASVTEQVSLGGDGSREASLRLDTFEQPALHHRAVLVTVTWRDRLGRIQAVRLHTLIAAVPP